MKVLVIDDDDRMRRVIGKILRLGGHQVVAAADGVAGMRTFRDERPDVVLTDIIMPEQEGLGTIMMLLRENPKVKVIAVSGGGQVGNVDLLEAARTLGAHDAIAKPFKPRELLSRIRQVIAADDAATTKKGPGREKPGEALQRLAAMARGSRAY
jgi:DNA-binding response OmpR family regulator